MFTLILTICTSGVPPQGWPPCTTIVVETVRADECRPLVRAITLYERPAIIECREATETEVASGV